MVGSEREMPSRQERGAPGLVPFTIAAARAHPPNSIATPLFTIKAAGTA